MRRSFPMVSRSSDVCRLCVLSWGHTEGVDGQWLIRGTERNSLSGNGGDEFSDGSADFVGRARS